MDPRGVGPWVGRYISLGGFWLFLVCWCKLLTVFCWVGEGGGSLEVLMAFVGGGLRFKLNRGRRTGDEGGLGGDGTVSAICPTVMDLTGKQKSQLRSIAGRREMEKKLATLLVGVGGLSENFLAQLDQSLTAHELVKVQNIE